MKLPISFFLALALAVGNTHAAELRQSAEVFERDPASVVARKPYLLAQINPGRTPPFDVTAAHTWTGQQTFNYLGSSVVISPSSTGHALDAAGSTTVACGATNVAPGCVGLQGTGGVGSTSQFGGFGVAGFGASIAGFGMGGVYGQEQHGTYAGGVGLTTTTSGVLGMGYVGVSGFSSTAGQAGVAGSNNNGGYGGYFFSSGGSGTGVFAQGVGNDYQAGGSGAVDFSGSTGAFKTSTGAATYGGTSNTFTAGIAIGSTGTNISASYHASASWTPVALASGSIYQNSLTLTGAAAGAECSMGLPTPIQPLTWTCLVTANTCTLYAYNSTAGTITPNSGTYSCRVFNP